MKILIGLMKNINVFLIQLVTKGTNMVIPRTDINIPNIKK